MIVSEVLPKTGRADGRGILFTGSVRWHKSKALARPQNSRRELLPLYSREREPTEHLWHYTREQKAFINHLFASIEQAEDHRPEVLKRVDQEREYITSLSSPG